MIVLKMEKNINGTQRPVELDINDQIYKYKFNLEAEPEKEFFLKLKDYENYKIKVKYYDTTGNFIKETNHIIRSVRRNAVGVMSLKLD